MVNEKAVVDGRKHPARNGLSKTSGALRRISDLFASPEFFPLDININQRLVRFGRMTRESYADSLFLSYNGTKIIESPISLRLDDVIFASRNSSRQITKAHYILNTAYCCSTLLSNYFELLPKCLVL